MMEEKGEKNGVAAIAACYQKFDPAAYLQYNYTPPRADFTRKDSIVPWKLACLHRALTEGKEKGQKVKLFETRSFNFCVGREFRMVNLN